MDTSTPVRPLIVIEHALTLWLSKAITDRLTPEQVDQLVADLESATGREFTTTQHNASFNVDYDVEIKATWTDNAYFDNVREALQISMCAVLSNVLGSCTPDDPAEAEYAVRFTFEGDRAPEERVVATLDYPTRIFAVS